MSNNLHCLFGGVFRRFPLKASRVTVVILLLCISLILSSSPNVFANFKSEQYQKSPSIVSAIDASVTIQDGDARYFANPPDVIAYANINYTAPPLEFSIDMGGGSIWEYYEWIALTDSTDWIEANTLVETTTIGVQFWGDNNDGWARVLVDDVEVWTGNTRGSDNKYPGGAFVKYLKISNLPLDIHTIRVENMGIGGTSSSGEDVTILFFGLEEPSGSSSKPGSPPGLIAYYPFDGDTTDSSGYGYDVTNYGATFTGGISGQALNFDGTDDYVRVPVDINPDTLPQVTIAAWVKTNRIEGTVISHDNGGYDRSIHIDNRGGGTGWSAFSGSGAVLGFHPVTIGEWVFIAVAYDQVAGTVTLYVNDSVYEESGTLGPGWDYLHIGSNPSFGAHFSGVIDEVQIYNYALSTGEARALYEDRSATSPAPTPTPSPSPSPTPTPVTNLSAEAGLVAYYPFDQDVRDYSGDGNDGATEGNLTFVSAAVGSGARFDGQSFVRVADSSSLDLYDAFTISAWLYKEDAGTGGWSIILSKGDTSALGNASPYALAHTIDGLFPLVRLTQNSYTNLSSSTRNDFKDWHLLTVTWDGENVKFYSNGSLTDTKTWNGTLPNSSASLLIGCDPPGATEYFKGIIDELRIYNYALTSGDINTLYTQGQIKPSPTPLPTPSPAPAPPPAPSPIPTPTPPPSPAPSPTPSPVPSPVVTASSSLIFESRSKPSGSEVQIPLTLTGVSEQIGNMDINLLYDPAVLTATDAIKGGLTSNSLFDFNVAEPGVIRISLADKTGFSGLKGSVANIRFNVIGTVGATSPLQITSLAANRASDSALMTIGTQDGLFTVITGEENRGDYDGDGKWTALDALAALQMAVGKRAEDLIMDVSNDGKVTSVDARQILQKAVSASASQTPPETPSVPSGSVEVEPVTQVRVSNSAGGSLIVDDENSPLKGLEMVFPPGALGSDENITVDIGYVEEPPPIDTYGAAFATADAANYLELYNNVEKLNLQDPEYVFHPFWMPVTQIFGGAEPASVFLSLEPSGYQFQQPVEVSIPLSASLPADFDPANLLVVSRSVRDDGSEIWEFITDFTYDQGTRSINVRTSHFSVMGCILLVGAGFAAILAVRFGGPWVIRDLLASKYDLIKDAKTKLPKDETVFRDMIKAIVCAGYDPRENPSEMPTIPSLLNHFTDYDDDTSAENVKKLTKNKAWTGLEEQMHDWLEEKYHEAIQAKNLTGKMKQVVYYDEKKSQTYNKQVPEKYHTIKWSDLFAKAMSITQGDMFRSLLLCHNTLRGLDRNNTKLPHIFNMVELYRPDGRDHVGAAYHFFGMTAYAYAMEYYTRASTQQGWLHKQMVVNFIPGAKFAAKFEEKVISKGGNVCIDPKEFIIDLQGAKVGKDLFDKVIRYQVASISQLKALYNIDPEKDCPKVEKKEQLDPSKIDEVYIGFSCVPVFKRHTGETYTLPQKFSESWSVKGSFQGLVFDNKAKYQYSDGEIGMRLTLGPDQRITSFSVNQTSTVYGTVIEQVLEVNKPISNEGFYETMSGTSVTGRVWEYRIQGAEVKGYVKSYDYKINPGPQEIRLFSYDCDETSVLYISLNEPLTK